MCITYTQEAERFDEAGVNVCAHMYILHAYMYIKYIYAILHTRRRRSALMKLVFMSVHIYMNIKIMSVHVYVNEGLSLESTEEAERLK